MRARSALFLSASLSLFVGTLLVGCGKINAPNKSEDPSGPGSSSNGSKVDPNPDVGPQLFNLRGPVQFPPLPVAGSEPIVIANCIVQYEDRQQVSAEVEGKIELIASPLTLRDGRYEWKQTDGPVVVYDPARPHPSIVFNPRDKELFPNNKEKWFPYWKLAESDTVEAGQVLCVLDDQMITTKKLSAERLRDSAVKVRGLAEKGMKYVQDKIDLYKDSQGVVARSQILDDLTQLSRFEENVAQAIQSIVKAEGDVAEANLMIGRHRITSRVDGIIRNIAKRPGEFVRPGEKIFEIQSTEKVRLEGNLDVQYQTAREEEHAGDGRTGSPERPGGLQHRAPARGRRGRGHRARGSSAYRVRRSRWVGTGVGSEPEQCERSPRVLPQPAAPRSRSGCCLHSARREVHSRCDRRE